MIAVIIALAMLGSIYYVLVDEAFNYESDPDSD